MSQPSSAINRVLGTTNLTNIIFGDFLSLEEGCRVLEVSKAANRACQTAIVQRVGEPIALRNKFLENTAAQAQG
jgi:hypothetical protein